MTNFPQPLSSDDSSGWVYVVGYADDKRGRGPFKIGGTMHGGRKRLTTADTFCDPTRPLKVVTEVRCLDRRWGEAAVHGALAQYRCEPEPGRQRSKEWFDCSLSKVEEALASMQHRQATFLRRLQSAGNFMGLEKGGGVPGAQLPATSPLLKEFLSYRPAHKGTLAELIHDVLHDPFTNHRIIESLSRMGLRAVPQEKLVILRHASAELQTCLKHAGLGGLAPQFKKIAAIDHEGHPLSTQALKTRCIGYGAIAELCR